MSVVENIEQAPRKAKRQEVAVTQPQGANPMTVVERAIEKGITGADLKELMDLQERWEAGQNRKAFDLAMAEAQGEMPTLTKNRLVNYPSQKSPTGFVTYRHEDLAEIIETIRPVLKKYGLAHRFRTTQEGDKITVTCVITGHGHREENSLSAGRDTSGGKNNHQEIASAVTYLERYTLKAALGLAAAADDDARAAGIADDGGFVTGDQIVAIEKLIADTGTNLQRFCGYMKVEAIADIPAKSYQRAVDALNAKKGQAQ